MICSTTRLTLILLSVALVACAKQGVSQDPVSSLDIPSVTKSFSSDIFFPYAPQTDTFTQASLVSNPSDAARFYLTYSPRQNNPNAKVSVNGVQVTSGFTITTGQIVFQPQPAPNAKIIVTYDVENPNDVMQTQPILIPVTMDLQTLRVALNATVVQFSDLHLSVDMTGNYYVFDPSALLFDYDDPYHVYDNKGLDVFVSGDTVSSGSP